MDWEACLQLWSDYLVIPAIYLRFRANGLLDRLPWEVVESLEGIYQQNLRRNASILVQVHRIPVEAAYGSEFTARVVFRDKRWVEDLSGVFVPYNRYLLIHAFIHQLSDKGHVCHRSSFRSFNDLLQLSKQMQGFTLPSLTHYRRKAICWLVRMGGRWLKALYRQDERGKVVRILKDLTGCGVQHRSWRQAH